MYLFLYLYIMILISIFKVIIMTKSLTSLLYIWICKMCKRKACHVCRRDGESGIRGRMWPVLINSPGWWRWREVLGWLQGCFRTNETVSCLGDKGWLWRREVIIPLKTSTLGRGREKKSKKKAALQLCHVWSHRAVQAEWKIALTPNKTVSLGRALAQGVTKICHPVWLPLRQPWTHEYIKNQYHIPALLLRNKGLSPAAVLGCAVHV